MNVVEITALGMLFACLIAGVIWFYKNSKKAVLATGFVFRVRCEKCGMEYMVPVELFLKSNASKTKAKTRTQIKGAMLDHSPQYNYMAKKFHCQNCGGSQWAEILNYVEYNNRTRGIVLKNVLIVVGVLYMIMMVMMGIVKFVNKII